ncbi:MAG: hypothetical protein EBR34_08010 [Sphingomonadaceae bacterium]|nr:hypothetical protein [Sphingomonadaceae bacterium]
MSQASTKLRPGRQAPATQWPSRRSQAIFSFAATVEDDNSRYRNLIERHRERQHLTYQQLASRTGLTKNRVWRLLTTDCPFPIAERDALLAALDLDAERARLTVSYFQDIDLYDELQGIHIYQAYASMTKQFTSNPDALVIDIKPSIFDEVMRRAFSMLLQHQETVLANAERLSA